MSVMIGKDTKVLVQGMGKTGRFHTDKAIAYGTDMVAAVHPSRAGQTEIIEGDTPEEKAKSLVDRGIRGRDRSLRRSRSLRHLPG